MSISTLDCPSRNELKAFSVGDVANEQLQRIAAHVADCPHCDGELQALDAYADGLVSQLRSLDPHDAATLPAVPPQVLAGARTAFQLSTGSGSSEILVDPGKHYARRLSEGSCRLGRFELLSELGVGSFGYVFKARDVELDRTVAVKIQRAGCFAGEEDANRFLREARSAASLKHPAIVSLYETGHTEDDVCFLVCEFVPGETLQERLSRGRLEPAEAARLVQRLAEGLAYAHEHGVIHRDVKPSNVMLDEQGRPHLMDFGLAKRDAGEMSMTSDGRVLGTPAYMSPEQARGESHEVDARTDIYSLGVVLYEALTGERPFQGNRRMLLLQVLEDDPRPPRLLEERIPKDLETICLKAMAKAPSRRYRTAGDMAEDLARFQRGDPIAARPIGYGERLWRWCKRYPMAAVLFIAVTFGSVAGVLYVSKLSAYFVKATALESARMEADMLEEFNAYYSDILARMGKTEEGRRIKVTHEYAEMLGALPLPASFTKDAGLRISKNQTDMQVELFSRHPWRKEAEPKNEYQLRALDDLERRVSSADDKIAYEEFTEQDGRSVMRYARAWMMKKSCVDCHNKHEKSPKKDWQEGDLAGVLSITRSLDREIALTQSGLRGAFFLMATVGAALVGVALLVLVGTKARRKAD